jgi:two-component system, chemotaxis family, chemotaxis protein CheY
MKALVVDDDVISRLVLESILSEFAEVDTCADGTDGVRLARLALDAAVPYDLICMDIMMPVLNGLEALQLIRQEEESCGHPRVSKVIVVSGSEESANIDEAFGQLCDAYIVKPVDAQKLLDILACLCDIDLPADLWQGS